jgi:glycosyltransferase involved in cell wall biosynthesis
LKVIQVIDQLNVGGAEKIVVTLANLLQTAGHESTVLSILDKGPLAARLNPGVGQIYLNRTWKWNPISMYRLVEICRNFDIVHVHSAHNLRYVFLASQLFVLRKTLFFHEHFGDIEFNRNVSWHQRRIYPRVKMIAVSRKIAEWAFDRVKVPKKNLFLLYNTIIKLHPEKSPKVQDGKTIRIVAVSNFRPTKNLEFLLQFFEVFAARHPAKLTIIGQIANPEYHRQILQLMERKKLQNRIEIITDCSEVQTLLGNYDLAVHTSHSESGPLVLIEYLAQGLPFLSFQTGEIAQMLAAEFPECILDNFSTETWIAAAEHLLCNPPQAFYSRADAFYRKYFSPESYLQQCLEIYRSGLASRLFQIRRCMR